MRKFLSVECTEILVHAFVSSRLDYCNSLLHGSPKYILQKLQRAQNAAARLIKLSRKYDHITPHLMDLHWLPIEYRIQFKILLLIYKALNGLSPSYLSNLLQRYAPVRNLRSSSAFLLQLKRFCLASYGSRAFSVSAPQLWNRLPLNIKLSSSTDKFKCALKTHLFKLAFLEVVVLLHFYILSLRFDHSNSIYS